MSSHAKPPSRAEPRSRATVDLEALVEVIARLTPAQRRALQRRLHTSGLFVAEELLSDQRKLAIAPALRPAQRARVEARAQQSAPAARPMAAQPVSPPEKPTAAPTAAPRSEKPQTERLAIPLPPADRKAGGKAVMGVPQHVAVDDDPHAMPPLPGQAPDKPIALVFDGGSRGNPGEGYGSYQVRWPGAQPQVVRLRFGGHMTNNEAEYDTLIGALEAILKRLADSGAAPKSARLDVRGDSLLVVNQVMGEWKCKDARMEQRRDRVRALLRQFGDWTLMHHDRSNSVRELGH